ncbi:MAG: hypothetical protein ACOXZO_07775 [Bacteroidales bacterium]
MENRPWYHWSISPKDVSSVMAGKAGMDCLTTLILPDSYRHPGFVWLVKDLDMQTG